MNAEVVRTANKFHSENESESGQRSGEAGKHNERRVKITHVYSFEDECDKKLSKT